MLVEFCVWPVSIKSIWALISEFEMTERVYGSNEIHL
jgi:hypothetical protein